MWQKKNEKAEEQQHNCQNKLKIIIKTQETIERSAKWPFPSPKNIRDYSIYNEFITNILSVSWVGGTYVVEKNPLGKFYYSSFSFKRCSFCVPRGDQVVAYSESFVFIAKRCILRYFSPNKSPVSVCVVSSVVVKIQEKKNKRKQKYFG